MTRLMKNLSAGVTAALAAFAFSGAAAAADAYPPVAFDMPEKADFVKSLNLDPARHQLPSDAEAVKKALAPVYNEKTEQHALTKHYEKGMTCVTCHDAKSIKNPAWMLPVTAPKIAKDCGDCHTVQADVFAQTDTHSKIDCIACHMPNIPSADAFSGEKTGATYYEAVRRAHVYKINVDPKAASLLKNATPKNGERPWNWAVDKDGHAFVDVMWSCGRATPADHTLSGDAQGCHSPVTSTLDKGLQYADREAIAAEIAKWQKPVKDAYAEIGAGLKRLPKLLEVTRLTYDDQTEVRLMMDKAREIYEQIGKDGSWGVHGPRFLKDRALTGLGYIAKAQKIIDRAGYAGK